MTEAGEGTFADAPTSARYRAADALAGKRYYRRLLDTTLGRLREAAAWERDARD